LHIKFGLATPSTLWRSGMQEKQRILQEVHANGIDHLFMADHVSFRNGSGTDGFVEVAALSQLHAHVGVMISIYLLPLRHPLPVARQLATMAKIAPGRMMFGVGVGGDDRHEIEVCGVDPRTRGKRTNESLTIIRRLLAGEKVDFNGEHFDLTQAEIRPLPESAIPIIVGGRSDAALARAGLFGDGWIGVWCSTKRYKQALEIVADTAQAAGRANIQWLHGYQPWVGVAADEATARKVVKAQMESFYKVPFEKFERYTAYGTAAQVAEQLAGYGEVGCRLFNVKVCAEHVEEEVTLGGEVRTELKRLLNDL
jgi:alkanesulfonate monooxygenase SsuD/methylene tetrahydromethanopterin reductase-like flavin-dependent oxidoreductase (luciferase family)